MALFFICTGMYRFSCHGWISDIGLLCYYINVHENGIKETNVSKRIRIMTVGYSSILFKPSKGECIQNIPSTPRLTKHELLLVTKIPPKTDSVKLPGLFKPSKGECIQNIHSHPPFLNVNFSKWQKLHLKLVKLNRLSTWFL